MNDCKLCYPILSFAIILVINACANQISLTGGERDTVPPQLDTTSSSSNYQLRFDSKEIFLEFDEFINFSNPSQQIVISPPLLYPLDIDQRGKKIKIRFDESEEFKEEATYIINFGESISDYTENNVLNNFAFVFSTGDYIDSLSIKGMVLDAKTKEPVDNMTVMLYDILEDSVVYTERPFYFAKTDKNGSFELKNLRADTFKLTVLEDLNLNYLYEENTEHFGFLKNAIYLNDTSNYDLRVYSFRAKTDPRYQDGEAVHDGLFSLSFDQELNKIPGKVVYEELKVFEEIDGKSVKYYIEDIDKYPMLFSIVADSLSDTISIRRPQTKDRKDLPELKIISSNVDQKSGLHPSDTLSLLFNLPLDSVDYNMLHLNYDQVSIDSNNLRMLLIHTKWEEGEDITLTFDSSAIVDFYGRSNDSMAFEFEIGRRNSFGKMKLTLENHLDKVNYIITLQKGDKEIKNWALVSSDMKLLHLDKLSPGDYNLKIVEDQNNNGLWDPGDYLQKKYAENIYDVPLEQLKENWTLEATIDFNALSKE